MTKKQEFLTHTEVLFGKMAYKFPPFDDKGEKLRPKIRLGDIPNHEFNYWYIGIDLILSHKTHAQQLLQVCL